MSAAGCHCFDLVSLPLFFIISENVITASDYPQLYPYIFISENIITALLTVIFRQLQVTIRSREVSKQINKFVPDTVSHSVPRKRVNLIKEYKSIHFMEDVIIIIHQLQVRVSDNS